jgi:hypothetical protein
MAVEPGGDSPGSSPLRAVVDVDEAAARLEAVRARLGVGAVYRVPDAWSGRTDSGKIRPAMVVGALPPFGDVEAALRRPIRLVPRLSWKSHFGPPPRTPGEHDRWRREMGWIFTAAGLLPGLDRDGIFETRNLVPVRLGMLCEAEFLGWLPLPYARLVAACASGARLADPYPPEET